MNFMQNNRPLSYTMRNHNLYIYTNLIGIFN